MVSVETSRGKALTVDFGVALGLFFGAAIVVVIAATYLVTASEVIAFRTGWGRVWVGLLLLGGATSLPEMVTAATAAKLDAVNLAAGNIFGSNMLNISKLAILMAVLGGGQVYQRLAPQHVWAAMLAILLTAMATLFAAVGVGTTWSVISPATIALLIVYIAGSRLLLKQSTNQTESAPTTTMRSLRWAWVTLAICSLTILVAAPLLASSADAIAEVTGIAQSFIGVLAVAFVTSLPELSSITAALRIKAPDLAFSMVFGSNAFNIIALAVADFFFLDGSLFGSLNSGVVVAGIFATILMVMTTVQLLQRRTPRLLSFSEPSTIGIIVVYGLGLFLVLRFS